MTEHNPDAWMKPHVSTTEEALATFRTTILMAVYPGFAFWLFEDFEYGNGELLNLYHKEPLEKHLNNTHQRLAVYFDKKVGKFAVTKEQVRLQWSKTLREYGLEEKKFPRMGAFQIKYERALAYHTAFPSRVRHLTLYDAVIRHLTNGKMYIGDHSYDAYGGTNHETLMQALAPFRLQVSLEEKLPAWTQLLHRRLDKLGLDVKKVCGTAAFFKEYGFAFERYEEHRPTFQLISESEYHAETAIDNMIMHYLTKGTFDYAPKHYRDKPDAIKEWIKCHELLKPFRPDGAVTDRFVAAADKKGYASKEGLVALFATRNAELAEAYLALPTQHEQQTFILLDAFIEERT